MVNKSYENFKKHNLLNFLHELKNEWNNQDLKFPNQTHSIEMWLIIIMEEIGEICKGIIDMDDIHDIRKEIIQTITLLVRLKYSVYQIKSVNKLNLII